MVPKRLLLWPLLAIVGCSIVYQNVIRLFHSSIIDEYGLQQEITATFGADRHFVDPVNLTSSFGLLSSVAAPKSSFHNSISTNLEQNHRYQLDWDSIDREMERARIAYKTVNKNIFYHSSLQYSNIPQILIFTHKTNLLNPKEADPGVASKFLPNIWNTIQIYVSAWQEQQQQHDTKRTKRNDNMSKNNLNNKGNFHRDMPRVWFLDNDECLRAIALVEPKFVPYVQAEVRGDFKADVCRTAALYLSGGYYMDADLQAIQAMLPAAQTRFVTAMSNEARFFNAIVAVAPRHAVLYNAIQIMLHYYQLQEQVSARHYERSGGKRQWQNNQGAEFDLDPHHRSHSKAKAAEAASQTWWNCARELQGEVMVNSFFRTDNGTPVNRQPAVCNMLEGGGTFGFIGCFSLKAAYDAHYNHANDGGQATKSDSLLLFEDRILSPIEQQQSYPKVQFQNYGEGCCCNFLVHGGGDDGGGGGSRRESPAQPSSSSFDVDRAYFFSRFVGATDLCRAPTGVTSKHQYHQLRKTPPAVMNDVEYFHLPYFALEDLEKH